MDESSGNGRDRSKLLNAEMPEDLARLLAKEGVDPAKAWMTARTDLNLSGTYEDVYLLAFADRILTAAVPARNWKTAVRISLKKSEIEEIRNRQGVGGGFIEALVGGVYSEVLAYSNGRADAFHKAAKKLRMWVEGKETHTGPEDDEDPRKCPKCGLTLEFKGDICRRCMDQGKILKRVVRLMKPYAGYAVLMILILLCVIALQMVPPRLTGALVDQVITATDVEVTVRERRLLQLVLSLFAVQASVAVLNMLNGRLSSRVGTQITCDLRKTAFRRLSELSVDYYDRHSVGSTVSRVSYDTETMKDFVRQATHGLLAQLLVLVVTGVMLFSISWRLALWTLLPAPIVTLSSTFYWRRVYPRYYRVWEGWSRMTSSLSSILSGMRVVKAFGQEQAEIARYGRSNDYVRDSTRRVEYTTAIFNPVMGLVFGMGGLIVWFVGGRTVVRNLGLTLGSLMAFISYLSHFYAPMTNLSQLTDWVTRFLTAAQRVFEIIDTSPQIVASTKPVRLPSPKGHIVFEHVSFGYNRYEPVIKDVSFEIRPGERVGIVGKSGSGKTTLINLLARFYDVEEGRITLDGIDIREIEADDLRRSIGIVLQEPFLFRGTIYQNLVYGQREADRELVLQVSKAANAHDFIIRHPLGYDTYIGERGAGLSGGERQRVSIARALLYDPCVLILDEATSNVDTESEQLIQEALTRITAGRTTISIAHRLSTLKTSDRIIVMDHGEIIEMGTHDELIERKGRYYQLYTGARRLE